MAIIKPFKGIRPVKDKVKDIASLPYDVITRKEAKEEAKNNEYSFLHVIKPEIDFPDDFNEYAPEVYDKGRENIQKMIDQGIYKTDDKEMLYIYGQTMFGKTQYGIVASAAVEDYMNNVIKKHELTRPDKEEDRMKHIRLSKMNYEPVFFTYHANDEIDQIVNEVIENKAPEYDFTADDDIGHHFWVIDDEEKINRIVALFEQAGNTYVADGHHRTAAAALVGEEMKKNNPAHTGNEEYNYFMAVHFPDNQLAIMDYNRVVKDLNGHTPAELLELLQKSFDIADKGTEPYKPDALHTFGMYLDGKWYALSAKEGTYDNNDPVGCLDVTILSKQVLDPLFDIKDLRKSKKIDFVGGIKGINALQQRVDDGDMAVAFALYPVSLEQLINIADSGEIMPPKVTWFEPKLRSGLVIHSLA